MRRVFGAKKEKPPPPSVEETSEKISRRGELADEKVKKLEAELSKYREQIKRTRPGPAQEAIKARAMRILKQKKMYEGQRDMLYNQSFSLDQITFATEGIKDAQQTMTAMKVANKELSGTLKTLKIDDVDKMQDEMMDLFNYSSEIQESMGRSYSVPEDLDEEELMGELDALEADMGSELQAAEMPSYLQPDRESDLESELHLPPAPSGHGFGGSNAQANSQEEGYGLSAAPRASLRS